MIIAQPYAMQWRRALSDTHVRDEGRPFTRYIGTLYTIRVRMTVV